MAGKTKLDRSLVIEDATKCKGRAYYEILSGRGFTPITAYHHIKAKDNLWSAIKQNNLIRRADVCSDTLRIFCEAMEIKYIEGLAINNDFGGLTVDNIPAYEILGRMQTIEEIKAKRRGSK